MMPEGRDLLIAVITHPDAHLFFSEHSIFMHLYQNNITPNLGNFNNSFSIVNRERVFTGYHGTPFELDYTNLFLLPPLPPGVMSILSSLPPRPLITIPFVPLPSFPVDLAFLSTIIPPEVLTTLIARVMPLDLSLSSTIMTPSLTPVDLGVASPLLPSLRPSEVLSIASSSPESFSIASSIATPSSSLSETSSNFISSYNHTPEGPMPALHDVSSRPSAFSPYVPSSSTIVTFNPDQLTPRTP